MTVEDITGDLQDLIGTPITVAWFAYPPDTEMFLAGEDMLARIVGQVAPTRAPKVATKFTCICRAREALK